MTAPDELLYAWIKNRLEGDSTLSALDVQVERDDDPTRNSPPMVLYSPLRGPGQNVYDASFDLTIVVARDQAYQNSSGEEYLGRIDEAMINRLVNVRPVLTGYAASAISLSNRRRTTLDNRDYLTLRRDFLIGMIPGGSAVPLAGTEADLTSAGINGVVRRWQISVSGYEDTDHTGMDDAVQQVTIGDSIARGTIDIDLTSNGDPLPLRGNVISATFKTETGVSWTDTLAITGWDWGVAKDGDKQPIRMSFVVTNAGSPCYTGVTP